jgi:hypothetical protein
LQTYSALEAELIIINESKQTRAPERAQINQWRQSASRAHNSIHNETSMFFRRYTVAGIRLKLRT